MNITEEQALELVIFAAIAFPALVDYVHRTLTERRARNRRTIRFADHLGVRS